MIVPHDIKDPQERHVLSCELQPNFFIPLWAMYIPQYEATIGLTPRDLAHLATKADIFGKDELPHLEPGEALPDEFQKKFRPWLGVDDRAVFSYPTITNRMVHQDCLGPDGAVTIIHVDITPSGYKEAHAHLCQRNNVLHLLAYYAADIGNEIYPLECFILDRDGNEKLDLVLVRGTHSSMTMSHLSRHTNPRLG